MMAFDFNMRDADGREPNRGGYYNFFELWILWHDDDLKGFLDWFGANVSRKRSDRIGIIFKPVGFKDGSISPDSEIVDIGINLEDEPYDTMDNIFHLYEKDHFKRWYEELFWEVVPDDQNQGH